MFDILGCCYIINRKSNILLQRIFKSSLLATARNLRSPTESSYNCSVAAPFMNYVKTYEIYLYIFIYFLEMQEADESLNFDEMILEAAKSIAAATSALVKAASAAQRELVDTGRVSRKAASDSDDGQWSEGLVSAAQLVAAATHSLVEAANSLVQGHATEEKLISAAKQVASSTAQLLVACKVKAAPDSDATRRLQVCITLKNMIWLRFRYKQFIPLIIGCW